MLANRIQQAAGGKSLPQGTVFLSHMESVPAVDVVSGKQLVANDLTPDITSFKFGNAIQIDYQKSLKVQSAIPLQSTLNSDYTIEFWARLIGTVYSSVIPIVNSVDSDGYNVGVKLIQDSSIRYAIATNIARAGTIYPTVLQYMYPDDIKFFRLYKKGSEHGLIINGTKFILPVTYTYSAIVGSYTPQGLACGNGQLGTVAIDEVLLCKDFGNDSTDIPTAPY